jgi:hypothetical protein
MSKRVLFTLFLATALIGPAAAQEPRGGVATETMERMNAQNTGMDLIWNLVGLLGLLGLLGFRQEHPDDSYHPAPVE